MNSYEELEVGLVADQAAWASLVVRFVLNIVEARLNFLLSSFKGFPQSFARLLRP